MLEFPLTRRFNLRWPHFTSVVLTVSALTLAGLTLLNVRLVGFETITRLEEDFNFTQSFWLDRIIPEALSHRQNLCQPFVLKMGDSFVTNSSIFLWDLELVSNANHSSSSLVYKGSTLQDCDITAIYLNGNTNPPSMDIVAVVFCKNVDGFDVLAKTAFPVSVMPGTYTRFTGKLSSFSSVQRILPYRLIYLASSDLRRHADAIAKFGQAHYENIEYRCLCFPIPANSCIDHRNVRAIAPAPEPIAIEEAIAPEGIELGPIQHRIVG